MKCPECEGFGYTVKFDDKYGDTGKSRCEDCDGTGKIADESTAYGTDYTRGGCE